MFAQRDPIAISSWHWTGRHADRAHERTPRLAAIACAALVYTGLGAWFLVSPRAVVRVEQQQPEREVVFREFVPRPEPAPIGAQIPPAPAAAAPPVPKHRKVRPVEVPKAKPLVAPRAVPTAVPREADPADDKGVAIAGDPALGGDPAGLEGGVVGAKAAAEPIALPEDADPPVPLASNQPPAYPQEARAEGRTGTVVLKVVIRADGAVSDLQVLRGEEPFVSAAVNAVRQWRYRPATYRGAPIAVYRIIQIPFKLQA